MTETIDETRNPLFPLQDQELRLLACARSDWSAALEACDLLLKTPRLIEDAEHPDQTALYAALFTAVVINHGRPFKWSHTLGKLGDEWGSFQDPRLQHVHDKLIELRDTVVAHTDNPTLSVIRKGVLLPDGQRTGRLGILMSRWVFGRAWFEAVHDTAWDLRRRVNEAAEERLEKLYGHLPELPGVHVNSVR